VRLNENVEDERHEPKARQKRWPWPLMGLRRLTNRQKCLFREVRYVGDNTERSLPKKEAEKGVGEDTSPPGRE